LMPRRRAFTRSRASVWLSIPRKSRFAIPFDDITWAKVVHPVFLDVAIPRGEPVTRLPIAPIALIERCLAGHTSFGLSRNDQRPKPFHGALAPHWHPHPRTTPGPRSGCIDLC